MPARLRPTAPIAPDAILVGDPGRALMLAQELLEQPKMSNHARGLWGYSGNTSAGRALTIQSTGMGGPSASVVLGDLAELGVRRAIRIGTCTSLGDLALGGLLLVEEARLSGRASSLPDPGLSSALGGALDDAVGGIVVSLDTLYRPEAEIPSMTAEAADMQTGSLLGAAVAHGVSAAAVLIATEKSDARPMGEEDLEETSKRAGHAASAVLSS